MKNYIHTQQTLRLIKNAKILMAASFAEAVMLLQGPTGSGKTEFGFEMARNLGVKKENVYEHTLFEKSGKDPIYNIATPAPGTFDYVKSTVWSAFEASKIGPTVLILNEVDKWKESSKLLEVLEGKINIPNHGIVYANMENLFILLTTNGRKDFFPEIPRRALGRDFLGFPSVENQKRIIQEGILGHTVSDGLLSLVIRMGGWIEKFDVDNGTENRPSPKELATLIIFCIEYAKDTESAEEFARLAANLLLKELSEEKFSLMRDIARKNGIPSFGKALKTEAQKAISDV